MGATAIAAGLGVCAVALLGVAGGELDRAWRAAEEHWAAGRRLVALTEFDRALEAHAGEAPLASEHVPYVVRAAQGRLAVAHHERALELAARLPDEAARAIRGRAAYGLARYEDALAHLDAGRADEVLFVLDAAVALGRDDLVARTLDQAEALLGGGDPRVALERGRSAARAGDSRAAIACFRRALEADPLAPAARFGLGRALLAVGERAAGLAELEHHAALVPLLDAREFARTSLALDETHAPNHAALGDSERALQRFDPRAAERADACYRRAGELAADAETIVAVALRHARLLAEDRGEPERALSVLAAAHARAADVRLLVRQGDIALAAGRAAEALAHYERALCERPSDEALRARCADARRAAAGGR